MTAIATESASELRRSGGFELIFPVRSTAHKYFRFFEGPRPRERIVAAVSGLDVPAYRIRGKCGSGGKQKTTSGGRSTAVE